MKLTKNVTLLTLFLALLLTGCGLLQEVEAPSGELEAVPLPTAVQEEAPAVDPTEEPAAEPTEEARAPPLAGHEEAQ